ncbi:MAG: hypothetical protein ACLP5H_20055 [Desulfomonilaceae bacterium]
MKKTRDLKEVLEIYYVLEVCCSDGMNSVKTNHRKLAAKLAEKAGKTYGDPEYTRESLKDLFDKAAPTLYEVCFLDLVRVFEQIVFDLIDTASGEIRRAIKRSRKEKYPFYLCAENFVKIVRVREGGDISNLRDVEKILEGAISPDLQKKLANIVKYRNWLAHGKRFKDEKDQPPFPGEIPQVLEILEEVLARIRPAS